jgi:RNA polymerase sigma-70 factor (sigma-E family)
VGDRVEREFSEFAEATWRELRRTAFLLCGDWHRAEDATQDALVKVYAAWRRLQAPGRRAYAHRAVTTAVLDQGRRPWRRERALEAVPDVVATAEDDLGTRDLVRRQLQALGPGQRACVVLRFSADLSVAETAVALGISEGTVKSQTARGLATLRAALAAADEGETR